VHSLPGDGRAMTNDQDASYNTLSSNHADSVAIGYNDEMSGWHNHWTYNDVINFRAVNYAFRSQGCWPRQALLQYEHPRRVGRMQRLVRSCAGSTDRWRHAVVVPLERLS
jgi:hypothetical protein